MDKDDEDRATDDPEPEHTPCPACAAKAKEDDAAMEGRSRPMTLQWKVLLRPMTLMINRLTL